ncbi:MAG: hypothetical protein M3Y08_16760 [Fibrobacterota bacterium]|nr:hypothetical protein [Fibrobacterota bacterium]
MIEALAAIVIVGIGIALYTRVQQMTSRVSGTNSKILVAGKLIERHLEDMRIIIARDTIKNWPPVAVSIAAIAPDNVNLTRTISAAFSPKDGAPVNNVVKVEILATWTAPKADTLMVTTYVSKRF